MNKAFSIAKLMLMEAVRDRSIWITMIVMPLFLTTVMGLAFGSSGPKKVPLLVVDKDESAYSRMVIDRVKAFDLYDIKKVGEAEAREKVKKGKVSGAILIPAGYGGDLRAGRKTELVSMSVVGSSNAFAQQQVVTGLANRYSTDAYTAAATVNEMVKRGLLPPDTFDKTWAEAFTAADKEWQSAPATVDKKTVTASEIRGKKTISSGFRQTSIGFTLTFLMFMLVSGATSIIEERQKGTLGRLLTTPTGKPTFLGGKITGLFLTALVQATILIGAGKFVFGVNWGRDPLPMIVILLAFMFAIASLGILVAALSRTTAQAQSVTPILLISIAMLSGCYWPIEITPPMMQAVAKFMPTNWAMTGLVDIVVRGHGWDTVLLPTLVLLAFGAFFMTIGVWRLKFE